MQEKGERAADGAVVGAEQGHGLSWSLTQPDPTGSWSMNCNRFKAEGGWPLCPHVSDSD